MGYEIRLRSAQIVGRSHLLVGKNRQDSLKCGMVGNNGTGVYYGVVCDGCSEGTSSEVGAGLATAYMARQIESLIRQKVSVEKIPGILHKRTSDFLKDILGKIPFDSPASRIEFIRDHLLFTILGFVYEDRQAVVFAQGDGAIIINDEISIRDENNMPRYIGYNLVERQYLSAEASPVQQEFDVYRVPGALVARIAIASDALAEEPDFLKELWGHKILFGLQRRVNVWSRENHKFQDDLSIITLEKVPTEG